jgi:hypothetical protein
MALFHDRTPNWPPLRNRRKVSDSTVQRKCCSIEEMRWHYTTQNHITKSLKVCTVCYILRDIK